MIEQLRPREKEIIAILSKYRIGVSTYILMDAMNYRSQTGLQMNLRTLENLGLIQPRPKVMGRRVSGAIILSEKGRELALAAAA